MIKKSNNIGKTFGIWKIIEKTNKRNRNNGSILYKCLNLTNNSYHFKDLSYLKQFKKRNSKTSTLRGRPRKWIITKVPVKKWKIIKTPINE